MSAHQGGERSVALYAQTARHDGEHRCSIRCNFRHSMASRRANSSALLALQQSAAVGKHSRAWGNIVERPAATRASNQETLLCDTVAPPHRVEATPSTAGRLRRPLPPVTPPAQQCGAHPARVEGALSSRPLAYLHSPDGIQCTHVLQVPVASGVLAVRGGKQAVAHAVLSPWAPFGPLGPI